jgi:hypothetical protein
MSARQWRNRLEDSQRQLTEAVTAANEWKKVADNRLEMIHHVDAAIKVQLASLKEVGEIFSVAPILDDANWVDTADMDGAGTAMYTMGKIESVSIYLKELVEAAASIELALSDTLGLATEALSVAKPSSDTTVPQDLRYVDLPSSPLKDFSNNANDIPGPQPEQLPNGSSNGLGYKVPRPSTDNGSALALFHR